MYTGIWLARNTSLACSVMRILDMSGAAAAIAIVEAFPNHPSDVYCPEGVILCRDKCSITSRRCCRLHAASAAQSNAHDHFASGRQINGCLCAPETTSFRHECALQLTGREAFPGTAFRSLSTAGGDCVRDLAGCQLDQSRVPATSAHARLSACAAPTAVAAAKASRAWVWATAAQTPAVA